MKNVAVSGMMFINIIIIKNKTFLKSADHQVSSKGFSKDRVWLLFQLINFMSRQIYV